MTVEKSILNCNNFLLDNLCDSWIKAKFEFQEFDSGTREEYLAENDFLKANEICARCINFRS